MPAWEEREQESKVAFDATPGGDPRGPWCKACRQPIEQGQQSANIHFSSGEANDMSGLYHRACARPFQSLAHALNMLSWKPR
jgi:hypothetical protein